MDYWFFDNHQMVFTFKRDEKAMGKMFDGIILEEMMQLLQIMQNSFLDISFNKRQ